MRHTFCRGLLPPAVGALPTGVHPPASGCRLIAPAGSRDALTTRAPAAVRRAVPLATVTPRADVDRFRATVAAEAATIRASQRGHEPQGPGPRTSKPAYSGTPGVPTPGPAAGEALGIHSAPLLRLSYSPPTTHPFPARPRATMTLPAQKDLARGRASDRNRGLTARTPRFQAAVDRGWRASLRLQVWRAAR